MRAVSSVIPMQSTCSGFPPAIQNNIIADLVFAVKWPLGTMGLLGLLPQTVTPCSCSGGTCSGGNGGYNIALGVGPFDGANNTIQGFGATGTPFGTPDTWVLDQWETICTLDVFFEADPFDVDFELYAHGDDDVAEQTNSIAPNFNFEQVDYTMDVQVALPLDLLSFTAEKHGERSAILNWTTANEINTNHFAIERSTDRYNWQQIGKVQAAGESTSVEKYLFLDENVYDGRKPNARYYYRLNVVDNDGKAKKSGIDVVQFSNGDSDGPAVFVYPNPSTSGVHVELNMGDAVSAPAEILIYNDLGQMVLKHDIPDASELEFIDYSKTNINSGTYTLQVLDTVNGIISTEKLIVQR